jgi:hypothetical protein
MKSNRLLCAIVTGSSMLYGASAGASAGHSAHEEASKSHQTAKAHPTVAGHRASAPPKHDDHKPQAPEVEHENFEALRSPALKDSAYSMNAHPTAKPIVARPVPVHPTIVSVLPSAPGRTLRIGALPIEGTLGGPNRSRPFTGAIDGTEIKRRR